MANSTKIQLHIAIANNRHQLPKIKYAIRKNHFKSGQKYKMGLMSIEMAPIQSIIISPRKCSQYKHIFYLASQSNPCIAAPHTSKHLLGGNLFFFCKICAEREKKNAKIVRKCAKTGRLGAIPTPASFLVLLVSSEVLLFMHWNAFLDGRCILKETTNWNLSSPLASDRQPTPLSGK